MNVGAWKAGPVRFKALDCPQWRQIGLNYFSRHVFFNLEACGARQKSFFFHIDCPRKSFVYNLVRVRACVSQHSTLRRAECYVWLLRRRGIKDQNTGL